EVFGKARAEGVAWSAAGVKVRDIPRFGWRAYHLDEACWFHGEAEVKKLLDQMAALKMNEFHWYLTDDQGWRIEIKKYPKLTGVGAWRKDSQTGGWDSPLRTGQPHGGFYTQEQLREIVRYAAERHINIVPSVNMPGHSTAAIASYPEMGTTGEPVEVCVTFGKLPSVFNVANENLYPFLEDILDEVMGIFPSQVIHLGGDEVLFGQWVASPQIKALIEREHLSGPADVQMYFTGRMSRFMEGRGRRMLGWNDIMGDDLHGLLKAVGAGDLRDRPDRRNLAAGTVVQFWAGDIALAERALREGHDIINSLHTETYLDYDYTQIPLARAYAFEPIPQGLDRSLWPKVLGLGCQMWSEWTPTDDKVEHQTFPRIAAYAEVGWTRAAQKDYPDFCRRLDSMEKRWSLQNVNFAQVPR
ncbi:family 20 glycosylhydrolase, partial [bacterium]|nr:family 20 glycosylhydrolase [bacterium]